MRRTIDAKEDPSTLENTMLKSPSMPAETAFEIRFQSLFHEGRALAFPCDACGAVDLDAMGDKARCNYLFARGMIGREYAMPVVQESETH